MRIEAEQPAQRNVDGNPGDAPQEHATAVERSIRHQPIELSDTEKDDARAERVNLA
jgi:hypothetical protein